MPLLMFIVATTFNTISTQQADDPDLALSAPFPISKKSLRRKFIRDLTGQTGWKQYSRLINSAFSGDTWRQKLANGLARLGPNIAINLAFLTAFSLAGVWYLYFLLWVVPSLTWYRLVVRIRNIGEHAVVPDDDDRLRNTRTTTANWLERAFIAPYNVQYHLEHHLIVNCPHYRLPLAHRLLLNKGLGDKMEISLATPRYYDSQPAQAPRPQVRQTPRSDAKFLGGWSTRITIRNCVLRCCLGNCECIAPE